MARKEVRYDRTKYRIYVLDGTDEVEIHDDGGDLLVAHLSQIEEVSATSYRNALWHGGDESDERELGISVVAPDEFDYEYARIAGARLLVHDGELRTEIDFWLDVYEDDEAAVRARVASSLSSILARQGARLVAVESDPYYVAGPWLWHVTLAPRVRVVGIPGGGVFPGGNGGLPAGFGA